MFAGTVVGVSVGITLTLIGIVMVCVPLVVFCRKKHERSDNAGRNYCVHTVSLSQVYFTHVMLLYNNYGDL